MLNFSQLISYYYNISILVPLVSFNNEVLLWLIDISLKTVYVTLL